MAKPTAKPDRDKDAGADRNVLVGVVWSCADLKLLLTTLLFLCSLATLFQLLPFNFNPSLSPSDLRSCLSKLAAPLAPATTTTATATAQSPPAPPPVAAQPVIPDSVDGSVVRRSFTAVGSAAYLFVQMGAYRGGPDTFAVVGLASKPLHVYGKPDFTCHWLPLNGSSPPVAAKSYKMLPDWGYGRVYTVVVVNCTFPHPVGTDSSGGRLILHASTGPGPGPATVEKIIALDEPAGSFDASLFSSPPKYDYLYCGSPLYGDLSPQRVREWVAYHARLFGGRAHFVVHDAGGVHPGVMEVLRPWIEKGVVTLQDIRGQEAFDGYYHNQFLVVNDCLHRYRFRARWMFFFDVDEFIYVPPKANLRSVLKSLEGVTQFTIEQMPMSSKLCLSDDAGKTQRMWGIEKLVYRDVKRGIRRDRKYAIQPRNAFAAGVHLSQNFVGKTLHKTEGRIKYFHYHGTIADRRDPCREFVNATELTFEGTPFVRDDTLRRVAGAVKVFEQKAVGWRLGRTRQ